MRLAHFHRIPRASFSPSFETVSATNTDTTRLYTDP
jgi:hypothetical protein